MMTTRLLRLSTQTWEPDNFRDHPERHWIVAINHQSSGTRYLPMNRHGKGNLDDLTPEDLIGVICRFSPEHIVEEAAFDFTEHELRKDGPINDSFAYYLVRENEQSFEASKHPVSKLLSLAGSYRRSVEDLNRIVDGLRTYAECWALREFWVWFAKGGRSRFTWELFRSWIMVHEVLEIAEAPSELQEHLQRLFPQLAGLKEGSFTVDRAWLTLAMDNLNSALRRCGLKGDATEPSRNLSGAAGLAPTSSV